MKLAGRVAVITGGAGAIGGAAARLLAREGARIAIVDHEVEACEGMAAAGGIHHCPERSIASTSTSLRASPLSARAHPPGWRRAVRQPARCVAAWCRFQPAAPGYRAGGNKRQDAYHLAVLRKIVLSMIMHRRRDCR